MNIYSTDGKPIAELYFGTKQESLQERRLDLGKEQLTDGATETEPLHN